MIYSNTKVPYAFIHNPRTSGTTLAKYLVWRGGIETDRLLIHRRYIDESALMDLTNYYVFGFVRNPFSREVSIFTMYKTLSGRNPTFAEWIESRFVEQIDKNFICPQYEYFCDATGALKANIFNFERRKESITEIADRLKFPVEQMLNYSPMVNSVRSPEIDYRTMYTYAMVDIVTPFFQLDMDAFGYNFDGYTGITKSVTYSIPMNQ